MDLIEKLLAKQLISIRKNLFKIEVILLLISISGYLLLISDIGFGSLLMSLGLVILATTYYFLAYRPIAYKNKLDDFYLKLQGFSLSVALIGILFLLQHWPGGKIILLMGLLFIFIGLLTTLVDKTQQRKSPAIEKQDVYRLIIVFALLLIFYFTVLNTPYTAFRVREVDKTEENQINTEPEAIP